MTPNSTNTTITPAHLALNHQHAIEEPKYSTFGSALLRIFSPLTNLLKLLIASLPPSLVVNFRLLTGNRVWHFESIETNRANASDEFDNAESQHGSVCSSQTEELERSSSGDSVSTADAIGFKLIHYQAALQVVNELIKQVPQPAANLSLKEFPTVIDKAARALQDKQSVNISFDNESVKKGIGGKHKRSKLMDVFRKFKREQTALIEAGKHGSEIPEQTRHIHVRTALASVIHGKFRGQGFHAKNVSIESLDKRIFDRYVDVLHSKDWHNIVSNHALKFSEQQGEARILNFKTTMTPTRNLDHVLAKNYLNDGVNGICSYAIREQRHAVNLWRTEFRPEQPGNNETRYKFSGLRHGVHDAYGIEDPLQRATANDARVTEFIHASVLGHFRMNKLDIRTLDPDKTLDVDIVSVNLLTPVGKEKEMIKQQQSAFARANGKTIQIRIADERGHEHTIKVKPRIIMFSTPVNHLSLSRMGSMIGIWRTADSINKQAIRHLLGSSHKTKAVGGMVAARIQSLNAELRAITGNSPTNASQRKAITEKLTLIEQLVAQIRDIYFKETHHQVGNEPYKLPTRLLALSNEIGATPAFNCKSGKDRTGQLNVETRDLYAHLNAHGGQLRAVNAKREGFAQENFQKLFFAGGDREIQALNTGVAGSKSQLPYYNKLMGVTPKTIDEIKGLSKWVGT